jgi:hypothetical protein
MSKLQQLCCNELDSVKERDFLSGHRFMKDCSFVEVVE